MLHVTTVKLSHPLQQGGLTGQSGRQGVHLVVFAVIVTHVLQPPPVERSELVGNYILMPCLWKQPAQGQYLASPLCHNKSAFQNSSEITLSTPSRVKPTKPIHTQMQNTYTQRSNTNFGKASPLNIVLD